MMFRIRNAGMAIAIAAAIAGCATPSPEAPGVGAGAEPTWDQLFGRQAVIGVSSYGRYLAGRHAGFQRDLDSAASELAAAARDDDDPAVLDLAHRMLLADGRVDEAAAIARRIVARQAASPLPQLTLALADLKAGNFRPTIERLSTFGSEDGIGRVVSPMVEAWARFGLGDIDKAIANLDALGRQRGFSVLADLHTALIYDAAGRMAEADAAYAKVLAHNERPSARLVELIGNFYERTGRGPDARKLYDRYAASRPDTLSFLDMDAVGVAPLSTTARVATAREGVAESLYNLALALSERSATDAALVYGRLALDLRPSFPMAQVLLGDLLELLGRQGEANNIYAGISPDSPLAWLARIRVADNLHRIGRKDDAYARLRTMGAERPERIDALVRLGEILRSDKRFEESAAIYDEILRRAKPLERRHWSLLYARGIVFERLKQWRRAEDDFILALKLEPDQPLVLNYLAYSWADQGVRLEEAERMLERAVAQRPNDGYIIDSLGWVLFRAGKFQDAVVQLERAIELRPHDPVMNDHLGDAYWRVGRMAEARFQWERALTLKPEPELVPEIRSKLSHGLPPLNQNQIPPMKEARVGG
ncbi:MAG: tetratricopeptide repeat protein [Alphaproteobacteria bacterium]